MCKSFSYHHISYHHMWKLKGFVFPKQKLIICENKYQTTHHVHKFEINMEKFNLIISQIVKT